MKLLALIAAAFLALWAAAAPAAAHIVGFTELKVANGAGKPLTVGVWYPTDAPAAEHRLALFVQTVAPDGPIAGDHLPLIVMSHGNGGSFDGHYDTALALAKAGFVVAAVSHTGDTYDDQSRAVYVMDRPQHIHRLIDYMLAEWPDHARIDAGRVGMFGFSAGGFTTLVSIGGVPDLTKVGPHNLAHPGYYDAQLVKRSGIALGSLNNLPASAWIHDSRIRAAVVAAPALGYTFGREGLKSVTIPVQLWRAELDHILPNPDYAEAVRQDLPRPPEFHLMAGGDHYDFLAPCSDLLRKNAPIICVSPKGFDRVAFHQTFDREVVRFFEEKLG